ncbi:hypothetical protein [Bacillus sp. LL01]|uniref:hypothetical protein n=1 Tax=Bacillus sp. LL01 TaxID=1665556 RepID=UPI000A950E73|nr:hypothetical protein [Bacillus sp. LL01]
MLGYIAAPLITKPLNELEVSARLWQQQEISIKMFLFQSLMMNSGLLDYGEISA